MRYRTDIALNWEPQKTTRKYVQVWVQPTHFPWLSELALGQINGNTRPRTNNQSVFFFFFLLRQSHLAATRTKMAGLRHITLPVRQCIERIDKTRDIFTVMYSIGGFKYSSREAGFQNCPHKRRKKKCSPNRLTWLFPWRNLGCTTWASGRIAKGRSRLLSLECQDEKETKKPTQCQ